MATKKEKAPAAKPKMIKIRQVRSTVGTPQPQREAIKTLGLRRIRHVVERQDSPGVRGVVAMIPHLVEIVED